MKKESGLFNVTMGAHDGAEECELIGTYMLSFISKKYNKKHFGLYRDDGLGSDKELKWTGNGKKKKKKKKK